MSQSQAILSGIEDRGGPALGGDDNLGGTLGKGCGKQAMLCFLTWMISCMQTRKLHVKKIIKLCPYDLCIFVHVCFN